jgi:arginase family enzyme
MKKRNRVQGEYLYSYTHCRHAPRAQRINLRNVISHRSNTRAVNWRWQICDCFGGEHSITAPVVEAYRKAYTKEQFTVVQFDGFGD